MIRRLAIFFVSFLLCACGSGGSDGGGTVPAAQTRTFYMGFSPWPYDATQQAVDWTYANIRADGDIISQHMEEGVPWPEAYNSTPFSQNFIDTILYRVQQSSGKKILLQISPLNNARDGMALYRGTAVAQPLPAGWEGLRLNSEPVKTAYLNYAVRMKESFNPDYMLLGVEANILIETNPGLWADYIELHRYVYTAMKSLYPSLPIGVSVFCVPFFPEWTAPDTLAAQLSGLDDLDSSIDFLAFSVHPFMSSLLADLFPDDYFQRLFHRTSRPIAISESSYPAQEWTTLSAPFLTFRGTQAKQEDFLSSMLSESQQKRALFVIWFTLRDYDALWNALPAERKPTGIVWRDTGLYDESGGERSAMGIWRDWYTRQPPM